VCYIRKTSKKPFKKSSPKDFQRYFARNPESKKILGMVGEDSDSDESEEEQKLESQGFIPRGSDYSKTIAIKSKFICLRTGIISL